jgi:predicted aldo/keto reductase-like oxidoreductase
MKEIEKCLHCNKEYVPTRRGVQKFCSNSCRSRYWYLRQEKEEATEEEKSENKKEVAVVNQSIKPIKFGKKLDKIDKNVKQLSENEKKEGMTLAGTSEAFVGAAAANAISHFLTNPATKNDINELKTLIKGARYFPVNNMGANEYNQLPYYDIETGNLIYY